MPDARSRRPAPGWTRPIRERLTPAIRTLVVANTLIFLLYVFVRPARELIATHIALGPGFGRLELWQPITSMFVHLDALSFIFNTIGLWFVGALIERTLGTRRFLQLFFVTGALANVAVGLAAWGLKSNQIFDGSNFAVLALFVAFGRIYDQTPAQILGGLFLKARTLAYILLAWALVAYLFAASWPNLAGLFVTAPVAYVMAGGGLRDLWERLKVRRHRRRYRVLEGGRGSDRPTYLN